MNSISDLIVEILLKNIGIAEANKYIVMLFFVGADKVRYRKLLEYQYIYLQRDENY